LPICLTLTDGGTYATNLLTDCLGNEKSLRRHRRCFHQYFQPRNLASYYPIQKKVTVDLLAHLLNSPENFAAHIRQYVFLPIFTRHFQRNITICRHVGSIVLNAAYGYEVQSENDFYITLVHKAMQPLLSSVHAGNYLVDFLPILKHVPSTLFFPCVYLCVLTILA